jgi:hypothetical protein
MLFYLFYKRFELKKNVCLIIIYVILFTPVELTNLLLFDSKFCFFALFFLSKSTCKTVFDFYD